MILMMSIRCSKHVEDTKNWIENIQLKSVIFVGLHYKILSQGTVQKKHKERNLFSYNSNKT